MQESNKIVVVACMSPDSTTGISTYYNMLYKYISDFEITVVTPSNVPRLLRKTVNASYSVLRFLFPGKKVFLEIRYFRSMIWIALKHMPLDNNQKIFHAQDPISAFVVRKLFPNAQIITTCHYNDDPVTEYQLKYNLNKTAVDELNRQYRKFFAACNQFICVSKYVGRKSKFLMPEGAPISVIPNAVDFQKIGQDRKPKITGKLIITNCGTLENRKNQVLLIELAKDLVASDFTNFEIWLIGSGPNRHAYSDRIEEYGLNDYVKLLGWRTKPWQIISQSHIYIHAALNENCGYTIIEAIAAGTYTLGINAGGVSEVLGEDNSFYLAEAKEKFKDIVLYEDMESLAVKAAAQYDMAYPRFDISVWKEKHSDFYRKEAGQYIESTIA
jgi:glycosyltransferase involved in cell wall biosynthesis